MIKITSDVLMTGFFSLAVFTTTASAEVDKDSSYFIKATALQGACVAMDRAGQGQGGSDSDTVFAAGRCYGATLGIVDSITLQPLLSGGKITSPTFCLPPEMAANDVAMKLATRIAGFGVNDNVPKELAENAPAYIMVLEALRRTFPCAS